jgi:hypothetical protein
MGDEPAPFDGKGELFRRPFVPALKDLFTGQPVKGDIQFDAVKIFRVELEPFLLRKIGGIENTVPPVGIIITARSDVKAFWDFGLRISDCGIWKTHPVKHQIPCLPPPAAGRGRQASTKSQTSFPAYRRQE